MLLFSKNDNKSKKEEDALYVFSLSTSLAEELVSELRLAGMTKVSGIDTDVLASGAFQTPDDMKGAIIDVGSRTDVDNIVQSLQIKLPGGVWFCLVGNSDYISLAQQFADYNISYFNSSAQKGLIVQAAVSDKSEHSTRKKNAISIAVLGCKGGVGNTLLAYHIANHIVDERNASTLLVSGDRGSEDLDFILGKKMLQEFTPVRKNLDACSTSPTLHSELTEEVHQRFEFIVFEQAIQSISKEMMRSLVEESLCIILVVNRSYASVRVAKMMLEQVEVLHKINRITRRVFVCFNDLHPYKHSDIVVTDLERVLGRPFDVELPYVRGGLEKVSVKGPTLSAMQKGIDALTKKILGIDVAPEKFAFLKTLIRK